MKPIIIDDIGYVQQDREEMEVLFALLADRYERRSLMIAGESPVLQVEAVSKNPMTTAAAIDRLIHHSTIVELNLPSYRLQAAKRGVARGNRARIRFKPPWQALIGKSTQRRWTGEMLPSRIAVDAFSQRGSGIKVPPSGDGNSNCRRRE